MHFATLSLPVSGLLLMMAAVSPPARAESLLVRFDRQRGTLNIDARDADARRLIHEIFAQSGGAPYRMDPDVSGRITMKVENVKPESALRIALDKIDADYKVTGGAYRIFHKGKRRQPNRDLRHDGDIVIPVDRIPRNEDVPTAMRQKVDIRAINNTLAMIARSLTGQTGVEIKFDRDVPGELRVDVLSKGDTLWDTVTRLAIASHLNVEVTGPRSLMIRPLADFRVWYRGRNVGHVGEEYGSCRKCKNDRKKDWKYCPMCGDRLN